MIQQTSLVSYVELRQSHKLGQRHAAIIELMRDKIPRTDYEISRALGYADPNTVRPRRNELVKKGLITNAGKRQCNITKKTSMIWRMS